MAFLNPKDCKPDKIYTANGVEVYEYLLKNHNINNIALPSKRTSSKVRITIHNTDDLPNIEDDGRNYTAATINNNMKSVRTHFYVDDLRAWQNLELDSQNWTCADGSGNGNATSIAIECIMKSTNDAESLKSMDNCARLTAWLLKKYNLTTADVYTHTYWLHMRDKDAISKTGTKDEICTARHSYKVCPIFLIPKWSEFLSLVNKYLKELGGKVETVETKPTTPVTSKDTLPYLVKVIDKDKAGLNVRSGAGVNYPVVTTIKYGEVYTVVSVTKVGSSTWGLLKAYKEKRNGWINLSNRYVEKIK